MFERLRRRLTLLCTAATGVILLAMACACLILTQTQLTTWNDAAYQRDAAAVLEFIRLQAAGAGAILDATWLSQTEATSDMSLYIELSGVPLRYAGVGSAAAQDNLLAAARDKAAQAGVHLDEPPENRFQSKEATFGVSSDGVDYRATAATIPAERGWVGVVILRSMAGEQRELLNQRLLFAAFTLIALALLALFSWFFTRRAMRPIEESRRKQTEFVAAASHELRSPLAVIHASLSAIPGSSPEEAVHFTDMADGECMRMSRLVGDMLALANADNGAWSVRKSDAELETLVLTVCEQFEPAAIDKGLHLAPTLPQAPLPRCHCDRERVSQVLTILVDNALSYTPAGGYVTVGVSQCHGGFQLTVADTGLGIPDGDKARIFARFYRADAARTSREHYGLGLSIAQEIATLHHGSLTVGDNTPGGSVFTLTLP